MKPEIRDHRLGAVDRNDPKELKLGVLEAKGGPTWRRG